MIRLAVDHPVWTLCAVVILALGFLVPTTSITQETDFREFLSDDDPIIQLLDQAEAKYGRTLGILVMLKNDSGVITQKSLGKIEAIADQIERIPGVKSVTTPLNSQVITGTATSLTVRSAAPGGVAPTNAEDLATFRDRIVGDRMLEGNVISVDGKAASINVELDVAADEYAITPAIIEIIDAYQGGGDELFVYGDAYFDALMSQEMESDLIVLFPVALFLMLGVLYLSFRNLRGILIPIAVVLLSIFVAMGAMGLVGFPMTMVSFIAPVLLLAIGIADGIHVLNRYNEETAKGISKREAILNTMHDMTGPVVMTSLTTAAGFLSLLSSFFLPQKQFGIITAVGVLTAMFLSLVMIPAILALLKPPKIRREGQAIAPLTRVLLAFERLVIRRRRAVLVVSGLLLVAMVAGLPLLKVETSNEEFLGKDHPAIQVLNFVDQHFSGGMQISIEVDTGRRDGLKDPETLNKIVALEAFLEDHGINKTISIADLVQEMNQKFHSDDPEYYRIPDDRNMVSQLMLLFTFQGGDLGNMALGDFSAGTVLGMYPMESSSEISGLASTVQAYLDEEFDGDVRAQMVGATILMDRLMTRMTQSQMIGLGTTMAAVTVLVTLLMGSIIAGLIAAIPLVLTVVFSMGLMAYTGVPLDLMTLMVSAIAVGIGVDYSIHFISRFRREYRIDGDGARAMQETIQSTGRGITYNALTVALGFFILIFASFKGIRMFGIQIAFTMVISALSAISIIPAILLQWRPGFLTREPWGGRRNQRNENA